MEYHTAYYWMVTAKDGKGGQSQSNVAAFTTREATSEELIVGTWFINEVFVNGTPQPLTDCDKKTYFQFTAEGFLNVELFTGNPCTSSAVTHTYEMVSESVIHVEDGTPEGVNWNIASITETELVILYEQQRVNFVKKD